MRRLSFIFFILAVTGLIPMCSQVPGTDDKGFSLDVLEEVGVTTVHGKNYHGLTVVPVMIDGREFNMVVDTGANATVLRRDSFVKNWPERPFVPIKVGPGSNIRKDVNMVQVRSVAAGGFCAYEVSLILMDMPQLGYCDGKPVDGLLGMNVMGMMPLVVDLKSRSLSFLTEVPSAEILARLKAVPVPIAYRNNHLEALMSLDGTGMRLIIDTGATQTSLPGSAWKGKTKTKDTEMVWLDVNGMARYPGFRYAEISSVRWGTLHLPSMEVIIGSDFSIAGADILSQGILLLDTRSGYAWWIPRR